MHQKLTFTKGAANVINVKTVIFFNFTPGLTFFRQFCPKTGISE